MRTPDNYACMVELSCTGEDAHGPDLVDTGKGCRFCDDIRKQIADQIRLAVQEAVEASIEAAGEAKNEDDIERAIRDHFKKAGY